MELQKELLKKHLKKRGLTKYSMREEHYGACLDAISEALSIANVVGQSEQLVCCENCTHFDKQEKNCGETCVNWSAHNKAN